MVQTKKMKKATIVSFAVLLTACNNPKIEGNWIEPVPGMEDMTQGFSLKHDGKAESINMATLQYEKWERKNDTLILSGKSIGNHQTLPFSDTLIITELSPEKMTLQKANLTITYRKQQ